MADYKNRYPTEATPNFQSSDPSEAAKADNGVRPWESHPQPSETFQKAVFKQKLTAEEGTSTTITGGDTK
jgi:hypothetical protein